MDLYSEFFGIIREFNSRGLKYAIVGGIAMAFHESPRFTRDIDILVLPENIKEIAEIANTLGYLESSSPWKFKNANLILYRFIKTVAEDHLLLDILASKEGRYKKIIENSVSAESHEGIITIAGRDDLIWMKKLRNSDQDNVDIRKLENDKDREGNQRNRGSV